MSRQVRVVTDSTSYLPDDLIAKHAIGVTRLQVTVGDRIGLEGTDVSPGDVAAALSAKKRVSTSLPSPASVDQAIRDAAAGDHDVCVVHLSSVLSGTYAATRARAGALETELGISIEVVDSRQVAMGLGFAVLSATAAAEQGKPVTEVAAAAARTASHTECYFLVDTLEHLRRGGRLNASQALLGTALSIKPILEVRDGAVVVKEKVRTTARALDRLEQLAIQAASGASVRVAVHHLAAADAAAILVDRLATSLPLAEPAIVCEVGAVVGAHVGPGLLGVVVSLANGRRES